MALFGWFSRDKRGQFVWNSGPIPEDFTKSQLECVDNAKWQYQQMKNALDKGEKFPSHRVASCFWQIVFSHFRSFTDLHSGYTLDLTVPDIIERTYTAMDSVLLPKLEEIIRCNDPQQKALLTFQYVMVLMAAVFDPSGATIHYIVLCEVLEAPKVDSIQRDNVQRNRHEFLEPLGFAPHRHSEGITWYWPRK